MASTHGESNDLFFSGRAILKDCNRVIHTDAHWGVKTLQYNQLLFFHQMALYSSLYKLFLIGYLRPLIYICS